MNTNKFTAVFFTLLMVASIGYAQFLSSGGFSGQCAISKAAYTQVKSDYAPEVH